MKCLIKNMLRPLYHYLKNKNERGFQRLCSKWGYKRFERVNNVKFLKYSFDVPDLQVLFGSSKRYLLRRFINLIPKTKNQSYMTVEQILV